jgi:hypothetical protein
MGTGFELRFVDFTSSASSFMPFLTVATLLCILQILRNVIGLSLLADRMPSWSDASSI